MKINDNDGAEKFLSNYCANAHLQSVKKERPKSSLARLFRSPIVDSGLHPTYTHV